MCMSQPEDMKVRGIDCAENVAFKKNTSQSSTWWIEKSSNAVDGDNGTKTSTQQTNLTTHWWMVDFGSLKMIDEIEMAIKMRPTKSGYTVLLSNASDFSDSELCHNIPNADKSYDGGWKEHRFKCLKGNVAARFMKVELISIGALAFKEVTVMGWNA